MHRLGVSDAVMEEILLEGEEMVTEDAKERRKELTQKEQNQYFAARDRALNRLVDGASLRHDLQIGIGKAMEVVSPTVGRFTEGAIGVICGDIKTEDTVSLGFVVGVVTKIEAIKGRQYQASWEKRGEAGIFANVSRKYDRIDAVLGGDEDGELLETTAADLAVYCLKWLTRRAQTHPEKFRKWIQEAIELELTSPQERKDS